METGAYNAKRAWSIALTYFVVCLLIGALTGVIEKVVSSPIVTSQQLSNPNWWIWTAICGAIIAFGYLYIWPRGTETHGRPLVLSAVIPFGLLWGICQGILYVSVWQIAYNIWGQSFWTFLAAFLVLSTFTGMWHALFWDIHVAPIHNILSWNGRKVALAHTPNLILTLTYMTLYETRAIFILLQTVALLSSAYFMRFPPFWNHD